MSNVSLPTAERQPLPLPLPDLFPLITTLQATAQALLVFNQRFSQEEQAPGKVQPIPNAVTGERPTIDTGVTRCYYLFPSLIDEERTLLDEAHVDDISELLGKVYDNVSAIVTLMKNLDDEAELTGFTVQLFGEQLDPPLDLLSRAQSFLSDLRMVSSSPAA